MHILICVIAANMRMRKGRYALQEREKQQQYKTNKSDQVHKC